MRTIYTVEIHYDMGGNGSMISITRPPIPGHMFTYTARTYKYTAKRAERVILSTPSPKWTTRTFYNPYHTLIHRSK